MNMRCLNGIASVSVFFIPEYQPLFKDSGLHAVPVTLKKKVSSATRTDWAESEHVFPSTTAIPK